MESGLTTAEARNAQQRYGKNEIPGKASISPIHLLISQFPTSINALLFAAALFSFFLNNTLDGVFIL
ncbi:MAG TPA: cation-transporting P-type ATPase, partial [Candidatus Eisenbacteria bacterium]|nr:cation-transporting P-type ATPase [Candidatus Eisenbacteria bacterium]